MTLKNPLSYKVIFMLLFPMLGIINPFNIDLAYGQTSPTITINDVTLTESNSGTKNFVFTITRSDNLTPISLQYKTTDGTATSSDYTPIPLTTLTFAPGTTLARAITVSVNGDYVAESDETFYLDLSNCIGCIIADSQGVATITNNDSPPPTVTINDISFAESDSETKNFVFTITRSDNIAPISLQYKTTDGTATSSDYTPIPLTAVNFTAGASLTKAVTVSVNGDYVAESDETFYLDLSNCIGCIITDSQGVATITNNDSPPTITINDVTLTEGNSGTQNLVFTISRSDNLTPISLQYKTTDGTATSTDYTTVPLSTLTFAAGGALSRTVNVSVNGDTELEQNETFSIDLTNCIRCNIADSQGIGTITSDELPTPTITVNDISFTESSSGTKNFVFTVTRSDTNAKISVKYKTTDGTATSTDYTAVPLTTLNFPAGGTLLTRTVAVSVNGDTTIEPNETFYLDLSSCTGCEIIDSQVTATIKNDDVSNPPPTPRPILITMIRGHIANQQELVDMFKGYAISSDFKFALNDPFDSIFNQLDVNKIATSGTLDGMSFLSTAEQGKATHLAYDPEWFEGGGGVTPEAEYKDYMNSVITASHYAHDNGFDFVLTPIYKDIQAYDKQFAPYVDIVVLQIPHFVPYYDIAVETAVQNIKSVNPNALVFVQLIPRDRTAEINVDPSTIISSFKSIQDHVDGVLLFYYDTPDPVPIIGQFYDGIGIPQN